MKFVYARFLAVASLSLFCWILPFAGIGAEEGYQHVRFPRYDDKTGMLSSEIESDRADALELTNEATKIVMRGVTIKVYLLPKPGGALPRPGKPLPQKIIITSKRGRYERLGSGKIAREDIAYLEGDVHVIRYRYLPGGKRIIDTEIFCDNATWNQRQEILNSTGPVTIKQPGSRLKGRNLYYKMKQYTGIGKSPALPEPGVSRVAGDKTHYGGEVVIRGPVRMITAKALQPNAVKTPGAGRNRPGNNNGNDKLGVKPKAGGRTPQPTIVTCSGVAVYNLDQSMVQFQKTVKVNRSNMDIASDFLRVMMHRDKQEIREMIAWGKVRITGKTDQPHEKNSRTYVARGDYARYTVNPEQLFLRDSHKGRNPDVLFGNDRLSDKELLFDTRGGELLKLTTSGGQGEALLHRVEHSLGAQTGSKVQKPVPTRIWYKGGAVYEANRDRALFSKKVHLTQRELTLDTDELTVEFEPKAQAVPNQARSVRKLLAQGHVVVRQAGCDAVATRAELIRDKNLVILFGPPHPQLEKPGVYRLVAPHIEVMQVSVDNNQRRRGLITGSGGPGSFVFLPRKEQAGTDGDIAVSSQAIRVRYDDSMRYNQGVLPLRVIFHKNVVADTDAYVLRSNDLEVVLVEKEVRTGRNTSRRQTQVQRIIATGNATLHSGLRHFKGYRIVRDVPQSVVTLYGHDSGRAGAPRSSAEVWEENGIHFQAPRIIAMENRAPTGMTGNTIHAEGPGEIVLPDGNKGEKAIVKYEGDADYRDLPNRTGKAIFRRNVVMVRQTTGMVVRGDEMEAFLEEDGQQKTNSDPATAKHLPRRLRRVIMRGNVIVIQGQRTASGTTGDMIIRESGDIITMTGSRHKSAQVVDQAGMRLYAPQLTVMQSTGIVTADGPGKVYVTSTEPLKHVNTRIASKAGTREVNYVILYDDEVKYNSLARKIKFRKNVRLKHQDLHARCERLVLLLEDAPGSGKAGKSEPALQVKSAEAFERVRFRRFEPARFKSEERLSPIDRVGKTVYTRSNRAFYDLKTGIVKLFGSPPDPEAIQQTNTIDDEGQLKRSRVKAKASKYILLNVDTGDIKCFPRARVEYLRNSGPLEEDW